LGAVKLGILEQFEKAILTLAILYPVGFGMSALFNEKLYRVFFINDG
jgi:hypothetical protein